MNSWQSDTFLCVSVSIQIKTKDDFKNVEVIFNNDVIKAEVITD